MKRTLLFCGCGYTKLLTFEGDPNPALGGKPQEVSIECEECVENGGDYTKSSHWKPDAMQRYVAEELAARKRAAQELKPASAHGPAPEEEDGGEVIVLTQEHRDRKEERRRKRDRDAEDRNQRRNKPNTRRAAGGGRRTRGAR